MNKIVWLRGWRLSAVVLASALSVAPGAAAGTSASGLMDISADGQLLACSNRDSGTVTIVDLKTMQKHHEVVVGNKPEGVTILGASHRVAVAVYADDKVCL